MDLQKLGVFFGNFTWDELNELWSTSSDYIGDEDYLFKINYIFSGLTSITK